MPKGTTCTSDPHPCGDISIIVAMQPVHKKSSQHFYPLSIVTGSSREAFIEGINPARKVVSMPNTIPKT